MDTNPFMTMAELAQILHQECGVKRSGRTVARYVRRLGYRRKKAYRTVRRNDGHGAQVDRFCSEYPDDCSNIVSIDETGFYIGDMNRRGYGKIGKRLNVPASRTLRTSKLTVVVAVTGAGVVHHAVLRHNCRKADFVAFVEGLPPSVRGCVAVMDNIRFHHSKETVAALQAKGVRTVYTPPYSPEFNPVEMVFGVLKRSYRARCPIGALQDGFDYQGTLEQAIARLKDADLTNYFQHVRSTVRKARSLLDTEPGQVGSIGYKT